METVKLELKSITLQFINKDTKEVLKPETVEIKSISNEDMLTILTVFTDNSPLDLNNIYADKEK